ncbi:MAG: cupin domain-containing protein [Candidatus Sumerlaeia bacterium]|nr:cupin domain-containing protein [Candidatus Sumerlaeia bacterium]
MPSADVLRRLLNLAPHPEGGWFRETHRSPLIVAHPALATDAARAAGTAIYFLLEAGDFSALHRVRSDETWHWYAGGVLELHLLDASGRHEHVLLGTDWEAGARPQVTVPAGVWQAARPTAGAAFVLCGCTVAPGFDFADFEMPSRDELLRAFPMHADLVRTLTRGS